MSCVFFFKLKTAYEMRISDWSSDVFSSDLLAVRYASGWYAADAGWDPEVHRPGNRSAANVAYDRGFRDGGGNRDDPFDTARRALSATGVSAPRRPPAPARPRPSDWPPPTVAALPVRGARRLLHFAAPQVGIT